MPGILHIFRVGEQRDKYQEPIPEYQLNYDPGGGNSYARSFTGREPIDDFRRQVRAGR